MNIRSRREIRQTASRTLKSAPGNPRMVALAYGGIICLLSLISTGLSYYLNSEIANTGGLSNMGLRSILSTIETILPIIAAVVTLGLEVGYAGAMLDVARGTHPRSLASGFYRFGPMIRAALLQGLIYFGVIIAALYVSTWIFMLLPAYGKLYEIMEPILTSVTVMDTSFTMDDATLMAAAEAMIPMMWIFAAVAVIALIPISYQFRMVTFCIADADHPRVRLAMKESRQMMRRNCFALFRLDLGFWWYYLLQALVSLVCYGDLLLPMLGITLPWSGTVSYFLFLVLSVALSLAVYVFCMNKVTVTYATAYETLRPRPQNHGAVLGNIFDM